MNLFESVKDAVPAKAAAEYYGIKIKRNGMACCPFHDDKTPSMKLDKRFHCFGCQEDGDVIDFVGKLFALKPKQAAEKLAEDFGVQYEGQQAWRPKQRPSVLAKLSAAQAYRRKENRCYRVLCSYSNLLHDWKERYAPHPSDKDWHPLFCEALQRAGYIECLLDGLLFGTLEERAAIVAEKEKELDGLEERIAVFSNVKMEALHENCVSRKAWDMRYPEAPAI